MNSSESEFSEDAVDEIVPDALKEKAKSVTLNLLSGKSKKLYTVAYNAFKKWRRENKSNSLCEDVLLAYFAYLSKKFAPPSLWATYSMLKCTISTYNQVDISRYNNLTTFLKKNSLGYRPKKSQVFSQQNVSKFLNEAPDDIYLCKKVALIFGISGALRREEFVNITVGDVKKVEDNVLLVHIPKTKNYVPRSFTITNELFYFCWKYMQARPKNCSTDRFFLRYTNGTCIQQHIGVNKFGSMPRAIAEYLNLPNIHDFTGHSFRRTSATLLVDAGADMTTSQRRGGWKSATVAFGYIADSIKNRKRICNQITDGKEITKRTKRINVDDVVPENRPSTSGLNGCQTASNENNAASTSKIATSPLGEKKVMSPSGCSLTVPENCSSNSSTAKANTITSEQQKGTNFYHPDIGPYFQSFEEAPKPNYIFNNCNITINGPSGNFTLNNCNVKPTYNTVDKSIQTDESG